MLSQFLRYITKRISNGVVAGQTDVNCTVIDSANYDVMVFMAIFGAITTGAATTFKLQDSATNNGSDWVDITGSTLTIADDQDNKIAIIELVKPKKRYIRAVVTRATQNVVLDGVICQIYRGRVEPVTQDATVMTVSKSIISA